jgi:hypothetical protein
MPENLPKMPKGESMKRTDTEYPGVTPSRDPDHDGDPRAHHQVPESTHRRPDPRGLREYDPRKPYDRDDDRRRNDAARRHSDATRRDDDRGRVR